MKFQQIIVFPAALFVVPALGDSLREALNKIPDTTTFQKAVLTDAKAEENMVGPGQKLVTLFIPSNKAMLEHQKSTGQVFRRAPSQEGGSERSTYHSVNDKFTIQDLKSQAQVLTSKNADPQTGKFNDIVTAPGGKSPAGQPLRARHAGDGQNSTLFSGLGTTARVIAGDYQFDRGVIHVIDT